MLAVVVAAKFWVDSIHNDLDCWLECSQVVVCSADRLFKVQSYLIVKEPTFVSHSKCFFIGLK